MESDLPLGSSNSTGHLSSAGIGYAGTGTGRMHHSLSTPAGVDCGGSNSLFRTPPATPKKGGKMLAVRVQMLDDSITMFQVQAKAFGRVLFDQVCRQLHLLEADYFGLEYQELGGTKYWLDLEKPICRQVGLSLVDPLLRFCVKFYTPDPAQLEEEFTRYLFCLQIKRDLAHGSIQCNENTSALMASYIVQAECGDFVPEDYPDHTYLSSYKFFPMQDADLERRIMENHKKHSGQSPAEADLNLLETARRCELYGMKMHPGKDLEGAPINIAVAHMGIVVFQHLTKINTFSWAKIRKISFKRKRFLVKLHPEGFGYYHKDLVEFFFEGRNECKNFWKKCVENHGFFRCSSVKRVQRHRTRVLSRGSSFRYSGRTQKQMVEFVRDNYVKRQTFQRSQSFRVSRSLRSSRANVSSGSANLINSSISAHPLLPLPPGSNAISLEWDKQPQYLEASLMMKGYTGDAAREELVRRKSEGATAPHRQLGTPTNCVVMKDQAIGLVTHAEVNHHHTGDASPPHRTTTPLGSPESTWSQSTSLHSNIGPEAVQTHHLPSSWVGDQQDVKDETDKSIKPEHQANGSHTSNGDATPNLNGNYVNMPVKDSEQVFEEKSTHLNNGIDKTGNTGRNQLNSDSSYSIDVLSGGESEYESLRKRKPGQADTLDRLIRPMVNSESIQTNSDTIEQRKKRFPADKNFFITKELLMTERTYKKDLEVIATMFQDKLSIESEKHWNDGSLCELIKSLIIQQTAFLHSLERKLCTRIPQTESNNYGDAVESKVLTGNLSDMHYIGQLVLDHLSEAFPLYERWILEHLDFLMKLEETCGESPSFERVCKEIETQEKTCYLPLYVFILKPLYRLLQYKQLLSRAIDLYNTTDEEYKILNECLSYMDLLCNRLEEILPNSLNYTYLCLLRRDVDGLESLVIPDRFFIRQGCLFKYTSKGPQQRMFFLFSDILVYSNKGTSSHQQFKVHGIIPVFSIQIEHAEYSNSFSIYGGGRAMTLSANSSTERDIWMSEIEKAVINARSGSQENIPLSRNMTASSSAEELNEHFESSGMSLQRSNTLAHVCWHRNISLSWKHLTIAMENELSGYLLRKFKNSQGWQRLWVVFASFCLYFYKTCHDDYPLASLPLLGYTVTKPNEKDAINKDFVFKLIFKNHIYFFRAESEYTYQRWMEVIGSATTQTSINYN